MPNTQYRVRAHAKLNLGLKIVARRPDGFHELRTVFQTISLADRLEVELARSGRGLWIESRGLDAPTGEANLAYRAAALGAEAFGVPGGIRIHMEKRIPLGAGLGGGSADAAAVLRVLARAARRPPSWRAQLDCAARLGSDVPALLLGGTVLGLGRGEEVYPLADLGRWHCVVVLPGGEVSHIATPEAFARWDGARRLTARQASDTIMEFCSLLPQVLPAFRSDERNRGPKGPRVQAGLENDFQPEVFSLSPDFPRIHHQLRRSQALWVSLTGSGAAQYGLFRQAEAARAAARGLTNDRAWTARFVSRREFERGVVRV